MKYLLIILLFASTQAHAQLGLGMTVEQLRAKVSYAKSFGITGDWITVTYHDGNQTGFRIENNRIVEVYFAPEKCPLKDEEIFFWGETSYSFKYGSKYLQLTHDWAHYCTLFYGYSGIILRNTSWIYPAVFNRPEKTKK